MVHVLRGLVCLGILVKHFTTPAAFIAHWGDWWGQALNWIPGTECFLVVSGYLLAHMFRPGEAQFLSVRQFARRRGYRLLAPYWVALTIAYIGLGVWRAVVPGPPATATFQPLAILANFLCVPDLFGAPSPMIFFWTIATLMQVYALWAAVFWLVRRYFLARGEPDYHTRTERLMIPLTAGVMLIAGSLAWTGSLPDMSWQLPRWCVYPAAGAFAHWAARGCVSTRSFVTLLLFFGLGAAATGSPRPLFGAVTSLFLVAGHAGSLRAGGMVASGIGTFGRWSYSVYLMHGLVGVRLWAACSLLGLTPDNFPSTVLLVLLAISGSLLAGWLMFTFVERPMVRRAAEVSYRR